MMLIYCVNLFVVVLTAHLARRSRSVARSRCLFGLAFASMVFVAGLRNQTVGTDTGGYVSRFDKIRTLADVAIQGDSTGEYGFWILNWILHSLSHEYVVLLFGIALIATACYQRAIVLHSEYAEISLFVFITLGSYAFFFNGARQGIACGIFALAVGPMLERNFKKYLGYVLIAFLFHKTAILMLPAYPIITRATSFKTLLLIAVIGSVTVLFFEKVVDLASGVDTKYAGSLMQGEGGGYYFAGFNLTMCVLFMAFRKSVRIHKDQYDRFLNLVLFGAMICVVSTILSANPSGLLRYSAYFSIGSVFLWPILFANLTDRLSRFVVGSSFVVVYLTYFTLTTVKFSDLIPYTLNSSLINW